MPKQVRRLANVLSLDNVRAHALVPGPTALAPSRAQARACVVPHLRGHLRRFRQPELRPRRLESLRRMHDC
eukprot:6210318-Pleurochrysis_carterae.AAC.1